MTSVAATKEEIKVQQLETHVNKPTAKQLLKAFMKKAGALPLKQKLIIAFLVILVIAGNAMNIIGLNFWLRHFNGKKAGVFTTLIVSGLIFTLFFFVMLVIYIVKTRPPLRWALGRRALWVLFWIGFWDGTNSWLTIYATRMTPEILQAMFLSMAPVFTLLMTKVFLKDHRSYCNAWIFASFGLMLLSTVVASLPDFLNTHEITTNKKLWSLVFFIAVPQMAMYNVYQARYMRDFTREGSGATMESEASPLVAPAKRITSSDVTPTKGGDMYGTTSVQERGRSVSPMDQSPAGSPFKSKSQAYIDALPGADDTTVKLVMLFGDTFIQLVVCLALLPADALPWFGSSATVHDAWSNLVLGFECLFTCKWNFLFCLVYSMGYVFTYVGCAYLNHYSATLSAMVTQLSSPMTAVILIVFPMLNANPGTAPWYLSVIAVILMLVGTVVYCVWEEMTAGDAPEAHKYSYHQSPLSDGEIAHDPVMPEV